MKNQESVQRLAEMIGGIVVSQAVFAAAELGIADHLASGPRSASELAQATGTHPEALYRLLRYLAGHGVFEEGEDGRFTLTRVGHFLRSGVEGTQRDAARMMRRFGPGWNEILHSVTTSESGFTKAFGRPVFEHMSENPEDAAIFDAAMVGFHGGETNAVLDAYDYSGIEALADIGGGNGSVLSATLERYPDLRGIWFDLPHVEERAKAALASASLDHRCDFATGNFFELVPEGADAYQMRHIIHDWYDPQAVQILENVRRVIPSHGRLLLIEAVISPGNEPSFGKFADIIMLLIPGGMERTEEQFRTIYEKAGFELTSITPTASAVCVIEGRPV
ncbi:MAG TPA: methyltransferase [Vicinamibacteria bacterium]|nr:methyltransferase [Vicinamibacteria bacterium]